MNRSKVGVVNCVYLIRSLDTGRIKIGISMDVDLAVRELMLSIGSKVELLYSSPYVYFGEELLLNLRSRYSGMCYIGSWFEVDFRDVVDYLDGLLLGSKYVYCDGVVPSGLEDRDYKAMCLVQGYLSGVSMVDLSRDFGLSRPTVRDCLLRHGLLGIRGDLKSAEKVVKKDLSSKVNTAVSQDPPKGSRLSIEDMVRRNEEKLRAKKSQGGSNSVYGGSRVE